ncbi:MAG: hypothetical protein CM1200mP35_10450 [Chloroflexota bacterium]|nr:MAG: hypothetical protein CM1200mP35_10450 [Chloroflexota bacterium]
MGEKTYRDFHTHGSTRFVMDHVKAATYVRDEEHNPRGVPSLAQCRVRAHGNRLNHDPEILRPTFDWTVPLRI